MAVNILDVQVTTLDINNTTTETDLVSYTVPANTLATNNSLRVTVIADAMNNAVGTFTSTVRIKYGATTLFDDVALAWVASAATRYPIVMNLTLFARNATNSQGLGGQIAIGVRGGATTGTGELATDEIAGNAILIGANASEDSTASKVLAITVQHSVAATTKSFRRLYSVIEQVTAPSVGGNNYTAALPTETVSVSESVARLYTANRALTTETVTGSETLVRQAVTSRALTAETVAVSESIARLAAHPRTMTTETVTVGETIARATTNSRTLTTETTAVSESLNRQFVGSRALSPETVTVGETLTTLKTIVRILATETIAVGESLARVFTGQRLLPTETITVGTGTLIRIYNAIRALSTETITSSESLTRLYSAMRALATETVTVTAGTVARMLAASRQIATETVTISETLLRQFIGQRLLATQTTTITENLASLYTPAPAAGTFERQMPLENVAITESLNRVVTNSRAITPEIITVSESITRVFGTTRTIPTQTTAITESLLRTYTSIRTLPTQVINVTEVSLNRLCNTARLLPTEIIPITTSLVRTYNGIRTLSTQTVAITESLATLYTPVVIIPSVWRITGQNTDFPDSLENIITAYIKSNWSITDPAIGQTPLITTVSNYQHQTQVDNFAYDNFRTYYIRVKEVSSGVKNRQVRLNTYEFETPIELEVYSRRLTKGESYSELNAMMNELLRIFGTYQEGSLFGIQGISLGAITSMERERPPAQTTWARRLRIILHYYRVSIVG